jgi:SAM-dependent methyltransferase
VTTAVRHPVFARLYTRLSVQMEAHGNTENRVELLAGLSGRVIEVGAGNGLNFAHYPAEVTEVVAVEPEAYLRTRAEAAAASAPVPVTVVDGTADELPAGVGDFDAAVTSLVLCSVPDPAHALAEVRRVVRPGGELRFFEHVRSNGARLAAWQDRMNPLWRRVGGGCNANRDTQATISAAGFDIDHVRRFGFAPSWVNKLTAPHILGTARAR